MTHTLHDFTNWKELTLDYCMRKRSFCVCEYTKTYYHIWFPFHTLSWALSSHQSEEWKLSQLVPGNCLTTLCCLYLIIVCAFLARKHVLLHSVHCTHKAGPWLCVYMYYSIDAWDDFNNVNLGKITIPLLAKHDWLVCKPCRHIIAQVEMFCKKIHCTVSIYSISHAHRLELYCLYTTWICSQPT